MKKRLALILALVFYVSILPPLSSAAVIKGNFSDIITKGPWVDVRAWGIVTGDNTAGATNANLWNANITTGKKIFIPAEGFYVTDNGALPNTGSGNCILKLPSFVDVGGAGMWLSRVTNTSTSKVRTFCNEDQVDGNEGISLHDFTIERTVLTGSYVDPVSNWNEQVAFEALSGTGLNLRNNRVERVAFDSTATPNAAGDKVTHCRGGLNCVFKNNVFWGNFSSVANFNESETGGYVNLYGVAEGNFIYNPVSDAYASLFVIGG